jgi:heavy metal sensor kinase
MKGLSIRARLTLWYSSLLAIALTVFSLAAMLFMQHSVKETVDEQLRDEARAVQKLIAGADEQALRQQVQAHTALQAGSSLLQVADEQGNFIYRAPALQRRGLSVSQSAPGKFVTIWFGKTPLRIFATTSFLNGHAFTIQVAEDMDDFFEAAARYRMLLLIGIPVLLCAAAVGGYWMSSRALAPVDEITRAAQNISPNDLTARVAMPRTRDELYRMAETLNALLQRIESAFRRVTQFTADASHELRTPVSLIRTRAEIALRKTRTEDEYRAALTEIQNEAEHVTSLIEDLMQLTRADTGGHALQFRRLDLADLIRQVGRQGRTLAEARRLQWSLEVPGGPVWLGGDPDALGRLVLILIDNAVKYTPEHGTVGISLHNSNGTVNIDVTDTGIGIPESERAHIFERFYRADAARSRDSGGAGLGLAIALWIAKAHNGEIAVQSSEGRGSCFSVRLPLAN